MPPKLRLTSLPQKDAAFIEPMECLAVSKLPDAANLVWEIKIDGYRAIAVKSDRVNLFSRTKNSFNSKFSYIVEALADMPPGTVIDGEIVAIDDQGGPNFNLLQNFRTGASRIHFYVFDLLCLRNRDTTKLPLIERRELLKTLALKDKRIKFVDYVEAEPTELLSAVREQHLEGIVGKQKDSRYEAGKRSGAWIKFRVNCGQELVIGGYVPGTHGLDSIIVGYYRGKDLIYVARVRNGFVPASRRHLFEKLRPLAISECPFSNLPERHRSRWGEGLTADDMKKCIWLQPELVAQIEFLEWTESDHLRHSKFVGLREDKDAREVIKEHAGES
jgi:bifunctional non-homologous end joining protein LigD